MRRITKTALLIGALSLCATSSSQAELLAGEQIKETIGGKRVTLELTSFGIDFPMYYRANGQVTGDGRGTGLGSYFAPKETGKWWVQGENMCQQFPTWYDGRQLCFKLRKVGPNQLEWIREDGKSGVARIAG